MTKHTNKSRKARRIQNESRTKYTEALASLDPKNRISFGIDPQFSPAGLDFHEELRKFISHSGNSINGLRVVGKNKDGSKPISAFAFEVERGASPYLLTIAHEHNVNAITDFACLIYPESRREEIHQAVKDSADSIDNEEFFGILYYGVTIDGSK